MKSVRRGTPAAEGDLRDRAVPRLLHQLHRRKVTGLVLFVDNTGDESTLYLRDGTIVHVERPNDIDRLDKVLTDTGLVSGPILQKAQQITQSSGKRLGQVLQEMSVLAPDVLASALRAQIRRKLTRLFFMQDGRYTVYVAPHSFGEGDEMAHVRIDPRVIVYTGIRAAYDDVRLMDELHPLAGFSFRLVEVPAGFLEGMGFPHDDSLIAELRRRPLQLADLAGGRWRASDARAAILTLLYTDLLESERVASGGAQPTPPSLRTLSSIPAPTRGAPALTPLPDANTHGPAGAAAPYATPVFGVPIVAHGPQVAQSAKAPPPTAASAAKLLEMRKQIDELEAKVDTLSHFEILGLTESALPAEVSAAYMKLVRVYHPDRLVGQGLGDMLKKAERIMARLGEASSVLADAKRRAEYTKKLRGHPSEIDTARNILDAEQDFKQGDLLLRKGEIRAALEKFNEASKKNPAETEYRAYLAWARYLEPGSRKDMLSRETLRLIQEALKERPHFVRGRFWIGEIHKHAGDLEAAEKAFRDCLETDASFLDAQRELRLIEMRRAKQPAKGAGGKEGGDAPKGFLNRLLKKG